MFTDPGVRKVARAIDCRWTYERAVDLAVSGFNPFEQSIYYGERSFIARWFADPTGSARDHNEGDYLMKEVWTAVHDYLHVWCFDLIRSLAPERGFGVMPISPDNLEEFTFLHLVTEAAAVVGLDYWFLSTFDVNQRVSIGTNAINFAVEYRESDAAEFRRACPDLEVQTPGFFTALTRFYCTGEFHGFDVHDLRRSARTLRWLEHELGYGSTQRRYTRLWLRHLAGMAPTTLGTAAAHAPVPVSMAWQEWLLDEVGRALWSKIKESRPAPVSNPPPVAPWRAPVGTPVDYRFTNLNALLRDDPAAAVLPGEGNAHAWAIQLIARTPYDAVDPALRRALLDIGRSQGPGVLRAICAALPALEAAAGEPRDLLLLN
jgi:hypothetical protein